MIRKRYYHYPSPIAIDRFNSRVLSALSVKLSRDYMGFFGNLSKMYTKGPQKKKLNSVVVITKKSIALLENMISNNRVSKKDVQDVVDYVEEINQARDEFLQQAEKNKALDAKIQKVSSGTGISSEDLSITKQNVEQGAAVLRKRTKEGTVPFLKRTMPGTLSLGHEMGAGVMTAALGPFAPIAGMVGSLAKGAVGAGKGLLEKRQLRKEENLTQQLTPMSGALQSSNFQQLSKRRRQEPGISDFGGISKRKILHPFTENFSGFSQKSDRVGKPSKEDLALPLTHFFGKKAESTKWTKNLLKSFTELQKKLTKKRSKDELVLPLTYFFNKQAFKAGWTKELLAKFTSMDKKLNKNMKGEAGILGMLSGAIVPLLPTIAAFATGIVAASASVYKIVQAGKAFVDWQKSLKYKEEAKKASIDASTMKSKEIIDKIGIQAYSQKSERSVTDVATEMLLGGLTPKEYRAKMKKEKQLSAKRMPGSWTPMGSAHVSEKELDIEYQKRLTAMISKADTNRLDEKLPVGNRSVFPGLGPKEDKKDDNVKKAIEQLTEIISRQQSPGVRGAALGDPYGVGDPLIAPLSSGQLAMEGG